MADGPHRRSRWFAPLVLLVVCFGVYAVTAARGFVSFDLWTAHLASWRIATTGAPWIDGLPLPGLDGSPIRGAWVLTGADGHTVIGRSPGVIAAGIPAYWLLGGEAFSFGPGALTAALLAALTLMLLYVTWRNELGSKRTLVSVLTFGFATPVWSVAANGVWPHTVTMLGIAGMSWAARSRSWWLVGLFGGITLWGRLHTAVIVAIVGLYVSWRQRDPMIAAKIGLVSGAFLGLICVWSHWIYGSWSPTASYDTTAFVEYADTNRLNLLNQLGMWVSPAHGILVWTPVILLLLPALKRSWPEQSDWARCLLAAGVLYTLLQAALNRFSGGDFIYGYRLTLELLVCAFPAFIVATKYLGPRGLRFAGPVIALQFVAVLVGAARDGRYLVPSAESWSDNGFLMAFRDDPLVVCLLLAIAVAFSVLLERTRWSLSSTASSAEEADGFADQRDPLVGGTDIKHRR